VLQQTITLNHLSGLLLLLPLLLQTVTGYRVEVVTVRKLEFETDAFAFADKVRPAANQDCHSRHTGTSS
jgi:hypothetical protein